MVLRAHFNYTYSAGARGCALRCEYIYIRTHTCKGTDEDETKREREGRSEERKTSGVKRI